MLLDILLTVLAVSNALTIDAGLPQARQGSSACPTPTGTINDCTYFVCSQPGDTCASVASDWGITTAQFINYNPSVGSTCTNFVVGDSYCVEENYGRGPASTSTTSSTTATSSTQVTTAVTTTTTTTPNTGSASTSTTASQTTTSSTVPSPTQPGLTSSCTQFYDVVPGDTCADIVTTYNNTFTLAQFYVWNPAVGSSCTNLEAGYYVCVAIPGTATTPISASTTTSTPAGDSPVQTGIASNCDAYYLVKSGDTCSSIVSAYGNFTLSEFYAWNPAVGSSCSSLDLGYYVCIGVPGATTITITQTSSTSSTGPSPRQSGIISSCTSYYKAVPGDTCDSISNSFGTFTVAQFESWNPAVGSSCTSLWAGDYYCVAVPGTPTTRLATTTTTTTTTTASNQPQQSGIVPDCSKYYLVASGDSCYSIEQESSITSTQFFERNTGIDTSCDNLDADYFCCVGVS